MATRVDENTDIIPHYRFPLFTRKGYAVVVRG